MRTLYRYIILSYIGPFLMTFFIAVFVLFMQFLWKYVDDLIGKGLDKGTLVELFFYATLTTFPLALPLSILLSSLMTYGNLGERFELVAMKSAGISLQKMMLPLMFVAMLTCAVAFIFANNFLPYINLKMSSLLYDIQQKKPALNIKEGIFYNGIDGYTIRIEKKENDGTVCHGVMIYDHTQGIGNNKIITAQSGKMELTADKQFLLMTLFNGTSYEEMTDQKQEYYYPLLRSRFKEQTVRFDLSGFRMVRTDEDLFRSNYSMLNIKQIDRMIDSMKTGKEKRIADFRKNFLSPSSGKYKYQEHPSSPPMPPADTNSFNKRRLSLAKQMRRNQPSSGNNSTKQDTEQIPSQPEPTRLQLIETAMNIARSKKYLIEGMLNEIDNYDTPVTYLKAEWHKKFTLSLACLILFFIGAPLGAIIRKGGLGMPVVVSVIIFILFWVITISGEKISKEGLLPPWIGMWISTVVTLPFGIFLTQKATSDSSLFDVDSYLKPIRRIFGRKK